MNGKKKGGPKAHAVLPQDNMVPELVWLPPASSNDKDFLGQPGGIKPQVWMVLIANLIFSVIHKRIKEAEQFTTLVSMAWANLISYVCFQTIVKKNYLTEAERNLEIVQFDIFGSEQGGVLGKKEKSS